MWMTGSTIFLFRQQMLFLTCLSFVGGRVAKLQEFENLAVIFLLEKPVASETRMEKSFGKSSRPQKVSFATQTGFSAHFLTMSLLSGV